MLTLIDRIETRATNFLDVLTRGVSSADAIEILRLAQNPSALKDVWYAVQTHDKGLFSNLIEQLIDHLTCVWCDDCNDPVWADESWNVNGRSIYSNTETVCEGCRDNDYSLCDRCDEYFPDGEVTSISGEVLCDHRCVGRYCTWCEQCDEYYLDGDDSHDHDCRCEAPHQHFEFPANGNGTIGADNALNVELPAGSISVEGLQEIVMAIRCAHLRDESGFVLSSYAIHTIVDKLDPAWVKKDGNFTRRLSKAMHKKLKIKLPPALISEIGNIARRHTSDTSSMWIEFTRALNEPAEDFYNDESCWWGGYSYSRCALKSWGGLGLRSFDSEGGSVTGRAWVQPLDSNLQPTHDTMNAHAYVVYNGYGNLEGYAPARIVAHLTGRTYRKVTLSLSPQYINSNSGYLVADEVTCNAHDAISYSADKHYSPDNQEVAA